MATVPAASSAQYAALVPSVGASSGNATALSTALAPRATWNRHHLAGSRRRPADRCERQVNRSWAAKLNWRVTNGIVYVFGQARTEWEHNRALAVAKQGPGIVQVVDHLRIVPNGG